MISLASHRHSENIRLLLRNLSVDLAVLLESWNKSHSLNSCLLDGIRYNLPVYREDARKTEEMLTFVLTILEICKGVCE